jgi:hypothetical protein
LRKKVVKPLEVSFWKCFLIGSRGIFLEPVVSFHKDNTGFYLFFEKLFPEFRRELRIEQERSWPHNERGCVTPWAIGMIPNSDPEVNEFLSTHSLLRWKALRFIKDECGDKAIHPKLPIEV